MADPRPQITGISTINDVARRAGVSIKTVSRVMNDEPNVRGETRDRVRQAAEALNYSPNLLARSLAGSRSFLIGLWYDNPNPAYIFDIQRGAIDRARSSNYHVISDPQSGAEADVVDGIKRLLSTIRLDGVILTPPLSDNAAVLEAIEAAGVSYVRVSPLDDSDGRAASVAIDDAAAACAMVGHLISLGHRDIGFVRGDPRHSSSQRRFEGYLQALQDAGIKPDSNWIKQGNYAYETGVEAGLAFFAKGTRRPTAIFSSNDYMAFGLMTVALQKGLDVPGDISIAGFDDVPGALLIWPHLTTIRQPVYELGYEAARLLLERAADKGEGRTLSAVRLDFELVPRHSARALTPRSKTI